MNKKEWKREYRKIRSRRDQFGFDCRIQDERLRRSFMTDGFDPLAMPFSFRHPKKDDGTDFDTVFEERVAFVLNVVALFLIFYAVHKVFDAMGV